MELKDTVGNLRKYSVGLINLGNTCYMNAALQCLFNIKELTNYFLLNLYQKEINHSNVMGSKGWVAEAYGELVNNAFKGQNSTVRPKFLKEILGGVNDQFSGYEQQDSAELLNYIIDTLHEDLNWVREKQYIEYPKFKTEPDSECA